MALVLNLPDMVQQEIHTARQEVQLDVLHHLSVLSRIKIYNSFGSSLRINRTADAQEVGAWVLDQGDRIRFWLSIITARKVLPIWEDGVIEPKANLFARIMIETAESIIVGSTAAAAAREKWYNEFHFWMGAVPMLGIGYSQVCSIESAYNILDFEEEWSLQLENAIQGEEDLSRLEDAAGVAAKAYSAIESTVTKASSWYSTQYDVNKRLEFWEWWLTEAIPQAWAMVEE